MEVWDLYNKEGEFLNKTIKRGQDIPSDMYHLAVHVMIKNSKNEVLIQKRSDTKENLPGIWAFTGGAALAGESSIKAAKRELAEETGINLNEDQLIFHCRLHRKQCLADLWFAYHDAEIQDLVFQEEEVSALAFEDKETIYKMIEAGDFHRYEDEYLEEVFKI